MDNKFNSVIVLNKINSLFIEKISSYQQSAYEFDSITEHIKSDVDNLVENYKKAIDIQRQSIEKYRNIFPEHIYTKMQDYMTTLVDLAIESNNPFSIDENSLSLESVEKFANTSRELSDYIKDNLEEIVTHSLDNGEMSLEDYNNVIGLDGITPEYKSALQDIIDKKEKEMAEQAAMEEEQGEKEEEKTEEKTEEKAEELSYADKIEQIKIAYQASKDVDKLEASMKDVLYEMMMAGKLTAENIALLDTVRELRTNEEQHEAGTAEEEKEEELVNPEEITDPIELALLDLDISPEIKEAIRGLDPNMPVVDYAKAVSELITNDLKASIQKDIEGLEKKKNEKGKLSFMDNVRLSSLLQQQAQLNNGLNLSLQQKLNALIGAKKDKNMDTYVNNAVEAKKTNEDKNSKYFTRLISAKRAKKFDKRIQELRAKNLVFNGEQIKTEIGSFDKKTRMLKLKSDFIAFNTTLGNTVKSGYDKTARFIKSTPQKIENLKQRIINLVEMPTQISDDVLRDIEEIENSRKK